MGSLAAEAERIPVPFYLVVLISISLRRYHFFAGNGRKKNREAGFGPASHRLAETFSLNRSLSSPQQPAPLTRYSIHNSRFVNPRNLASPDLSEELLCALYSEEGHGEKTPVMVPAGSRLRCVFRRTLLLHLDGLFQPAGSQVEVRVDLLGPFGPTCLRLKTAPEWSES